MTNFQWTLIEPSPGSARPGPRWGHSCCVVNENLYLFGGFANSNYMNDMWMYSLKDLAWSQIVALGDIPQPRSNATLSYDSANHQLILFGGGGPNKQRFNQITVLNLNNHNWVQLPCFENQPSPWHRTYHIAQFKFPYLVIFGGEGIDDLGDLWAYNMETLSWKEIKVPTNGTQPSARRFHTSCIIDNSIYIYAGCETKYACLNDLHKIDLTSFFETEDMTHLKWQQIKLNGDKASQRWGHTCHHYNRQIYVFGGRGNNDLHDLFAINPQTGKVRQIKGSSPPSARRRHSGGFVGSCLVIFGGFDGNYFNDLNYINLYTNKSQKESSNQSFQSLTYTDNDIFSYNKQKMSINTALIGKYFEKQEDMLQFLNGINHFYLIEELQVSFQTLYKGYGKFPIEKNHRNIMKFHPSQTFPTYKDILEEININNYEKRLLRNEGRALQLEPIQLERYIRSIQQHWQCNKYFKLNNKEILKLNKQLLCQNSKFFEILLSNKFKAEQFTPINLKNCTAVHLSLVFAFLHSKFLVFPKSYTHEFIIEMVQLAQYFIIPSLLKACEDELSLRVVSSNCQQLSQVSKQFRLDNLSQKCSFFILNEKTLNGSKQKNCLLSQSDEKKLDAKTLKIYKEIQFDLAHKKPQSKLTKNSKNGLELQQKIQFSNKQNYSTNELPKKTLSTMFK